MARRLSFRGLGQRQLLPPHAAAIARRLRNHTGCGNTLDLRPPACCSWCSIQPALLGRRDGRRRLPLRPRAGARPRRPRLRPQRPSSPRWRQDPVLSRLKMIAEPWDIGPGGYQLGGFPGGWLEWNDRFRDTLRGWVEGHGTRGDFAQRLWPRPTSSSRAARRRRAVNFIVAHDGFTLATWSATPPGTTRPTARTTATATATTIRPTSASKDRRPARQRRARPACSAPCWLQRPARAGHADARRRRRTRPHAGRQQQRLLPGQPDSWLDWSDRADADLIAFTPPLALRRPACRFANRWYDGLPTATACQDVAPTLRVDGRNCTATIRWQPPTCRASAAHDRPPGRRAVPCCCWSTARRPAVDFMLPSRRGQGALLDSAQPRGRRWQGSAATR